MVNQHYLTAVAQAELKRHAAGMRHRIAVLRMLRQVRGL